MQAYTFLIGIFNSKNPHEALSATIFSEIIFQPLQWACLFGSQVALAPGGATDANVARLQSPRGVPPFRLPSAIRQGQGRCADAGA